MDSTAVFFSFNGRLRRLPFLGYSLLLGALVGFVATISLFATSGSWIGLVIVGVAILAGIWCSLALQCKRLHDIGVSGMHLIWMYGLGLVTALLPEGFELVVVALSIVSLLATLWTYLMPGQAHGNRFGPGSSDLRNTAFGRG